jgi:hypothetical protein
MGLDHAKSFEQISIQEEKAMVSQHHDWESALQQQ